MEVFLGTICAFGFNFNAEGWALCNGQLLPVLQYQALFALLNTQFGGDGRNNFGVPNLQGTAAIGMGQGPDGHTYEVGDLGGAESPSVTIANLPQHTHQVTFTLNGNSGDGSSTAPASNFPGKSPASGRDTNNLYAATATSGVYMASPAITLASTPANTSSTVDIRRPYMTVNYLIALEGLYPTRS